MRELPIFLSFLSLASSCTGIGDCEFDSPKAEIARSLSHSQLTDIYGDAMSSVESKFGINLCCGYVDTEELPESLTDAGVILISVHPMSAYLRLEGCMDHYLDIAIVRKKGQPHRMELQSGEGPSATKEILWRADET